MVFEGGGGVGGGVVCGLSLVCCKESWEWVEVTFSWVGGLCEIGSISSVRRLDMLLSGVGLRPCVVGDGFQDLHWYILRWLEFCFIWVLRVLPPWRAVRVVNGGCMLGFMRAEDE